MLDPALSMLTFSSDDRAISRDVLPASMSTGNAIAQGRRRDWPDEAGKN